jgi:hypothetical protein
MRSFPGKAIGAEALRLILPLLLRLATVDFFGIDDFRDRVDDEDHAPHLSSSLLARLPSRIEPQPEMNPWRLCTEVIYSFHRRIV